MTNSSLRPDLHSQSMSAHQSMSANVYSSHPVPALHSSAPVVSTAEHLWSSFSAAANLPTSGYSWMSQTFSGVQPLFDYTSRLGATEGMSVLSGPAAEASTVGLQNLTRHAGLLTSEARGDSQLAVVPGTETGDDDNQDDSSVLSLSVNRFV